MRSTAPRKGVQAARKSRGELCPHASWPHTMTGAGQDPIGADGIVRTKTRHAEAFAKHVEEHDEREQKIARRGHDAQEPSHNQASPLSSRSGANRADSKCSTGRKAMTV